MKTERKETVELTYTCEICGTMYKDEDRALQCESLPLIEIGFKEGDRVLIRGLTKGRWFWKQPVEAEIVEVCGPYPPHPLAGHGSLPWSTTESGTLYFPTVFSHRPERYVDKGFNTDNHIYFYGVKRGNDRIFTHWYFVEELELIE